MKNKRLTRILCMILVFALVLPMIPSDLSFGFVIRAHAEGFQPDIIQEADPSEPDPAPPATTSAMPLLLLVVVAVGGAGYYLKVYKPKQAKNKQPEELESMEFEDDPEVNEDTPSGDLYVEDELDDAIE